MPIKKGLLFYGPPGTGKTHTIHYLASQLPDHTTLLITAEQVGLLDHYIQLARFLQPAMIVVEDVDLIARARDDMRSACEESLLNKLLNEMDGLREDAAILFVLTTNRPEQLESALASRPGRVDQAIEFPLPDESGRRQLIRLYACGLKLDAELIEMTVGKTKGASAAFIKELMRRAAQFHLQSGSDGLLQSQQLESALEEILFSGGSLNVKLLGGASIPRGTVH
jgi:ATP-dependent 26S proteasome regulatory subunit